MIVAAGAALEACAPPAASFAPRSMADPNTAMVLRNATVLTMDPASPAADAVAIVGDTITAVGTESEVLAAAAPNATIVDLDGRVLVPGFNDAHCHRIGDREISGYESAEAAIEDALAGGWTSICELFVSQERLDELRALGDANRLRLRVNCFLPVNYLDDKFGVWFGDYRPHQVFSPNLRKRPHEERIYRLSIYPVVSVGVRMEPKISLFVLRRTGTDWQITDYMFNRPGSSLRRGRPRGRGHQHLTDGRRAAGDLGLRHRPGGQHHRAAEQVALRV